VITDVRRAFDSFVLYNDVVHNVKKSRPACRDICPGRLFLIFLITSQHTGISCVGYYSWDISARKDFFCQGIFSTMFIFDEKILREFLSPAGFFIQCLIVRYCYYAKVSGSVSTSAAASARVIASIARLSM
jgi:hypothetical protein